MRLLVPNTPGLIAPCVSKSTGRNILVMDGFVCMMKLEYSGSWIGINKAQTIERGHDAKQILIKSCLQLLVMCKC